MKSFFSRFYEPFNGFSHLFGAIISVGLLIVLLIKAAENSFNEKIAFVVYGLSLIGMFTSSAVYHLVKTTEEKAKMLKKIDHIMIFFLIAGTYTPIAAIGLPDQKSTLILSIVWGIAALGVLKKIYWIHAPRWISTLTYLGMGWIAVFIFPPLWDAFPHGFIYWISIGGLFYTVGAIIYGMKKPNPFPGVFGFHEIWHIMVMGGAFSHYWAIYYYLP